MYFPRRFMTVSEPSLPGTGLSRFDYGDHDQPFSPMPIIGLVLHLAEIAGAAQMVCAERLIAKNQEAPDYKHLPGSRLPGASVKN